MGVELREVETEEKVEEWAEEGGEGGMEGGGGGSSILRTRACAPAGDLPCGRSRRAAARVLHTLSLHRLPALLVRRRGWWARLRRRRIGDAGVGGGSVASVGADGFAPGRPGRRPGAAAVAATNRSLRHPLRLSLL